MTSTCGKRFPETQAPEQQCRHYRIQITHVKVERSLKFDAVPHQVDNSLDDVAVLGTMCSIIIRRIDRPTTFHDFNVDLDRRHPHVTALDSPGMLYIRNICFQYLFLISQIELPQVLERNSPILCNTIA